MRFGLRVPEIVAEINEPLRGPSPTIISSINLGEAHYTVARQKGFNAADSIWNFFRHAAIVETPSIDITYEAAKLVVTSRIPWADAHAAATAMAHNGVVWAGDEHLNKPGPWKRRDLRKLGVSPQGRRKKLLNSVHPVSLLKWARTAAWWAT